MDHFWLVWRDDGGTPTYKHQTPESAKQEAERLAVQNPGQRFHVMQVMATACYARVQWQEYGDFVPF